MRISIPEATLHQELNGETVLLSLETGVYHTLDRVGTRMWNLLAEHRDPEVVLRLLHREYDVSAERLREDLDRFLAELKALRLVREEP